MAASQGISHGPLSLPCHLTVFVVSAFHQLSLGSWFTHSHDRHFGFKGEGQVLLGIQECPALALAVYMESIRELCHSAFLLADRQPPVGTLTVLLDFIPISSALGTSECLKQLKIWGCFGFNLSIHSLMQLNTVPLVNIYKVLFPASHHYTHTQAH